MGAIMAGEATPAQIGGFLVALRIKGETPDEIAGFAEAIRDHVARRPPAARRPRRHRRHRRRRPGDDQHLDRGGAGRRRGRRWLSPSTATGRCRRPPARPTCSRRSASRSSCPPERIERSIDELGFGFLFAPTHHPGFRHAAPVRRELATRTVFNVLGPLTNPAGARAQVVGVYDAALVPHDRRGARAARREARVRRPRGVRRSTSSRRPGRTSSARSWTARCASARSTPRRSACRAARPRSCGAARRARTQRRSARSSRAGSRARSATRSCSTPPGAIAAGGHADDLRDGLEIARRRRRLRSRGGAARGARRLLQGHG